MAGPWEKFGAAPDAAAGPWSKFAPASDTSDPSEGGGTIQFGPFDTGIKIPQGVNRALIGAGKSVADVGRGVKQLGALVGNSISPSLVSNDTLKGIQSEVDEAKRLDAPIMKTGAGQAGYLGGALATTLIPAAGIARGAAGLGMARTAGVAGQFVNPASYLAAGSAGALQGAIQPVASDESRAFNTGVGTVGGIAGNALINGIGRVAQPFANGLGEAGQKAVDTLSAAGIPLDAAQRSGNAFLGRLKSSFMDNPFTMGAQRDFGQGQQTAFNRAVLDKIGATGDAATQDVMGASAKRINGTFGDILDRNSMNVSAPFIDSLASIQAKALEQERRPIANIINRITDSIGPDNKIPGQVAYGIKKDLDGMASTADSTQNHFARQVRSDLMDGINGSLSGADQAAFAEARGQFRNMKQMEGAIDKEGTGSISPSRLANILGNKSNRPQSIYGMGDQQLVDLAQSGKQLLPDKLPNSGTAARIAMQVGLPLAAGGIDGAANGDWTSGIKTAATVAALPKLAQFAMNNQALARYLSEGIKDGPARSLMLAPHENPLLGGALRRLLNPGGGLLNAPTDY